MVDSILGRAAYRNHELFEKYGPVVRVEPNFVMLADPKYLKEIYGHGSSFYKTEVRKDATFELIQLSEMCRCSSTVLSRFFRKM